MMYRRARNNSCVVYGCMEQEEHTAIKKIEQGWEALDPWAHFPKPRIGACKAVYHP